MAEDVKEAASSKQWTASLKQPWERRRRARLLRTGAEVGWNERHRRNVLRLSSRDPGVLEKGTVGKRKKEMKRDVMGKRERENRPMLRR
jgi:hypothetical protein